jgi:hypothetical protein
VEDEYFQSNYPALFEFICQVPDGAPEEFRTSSLTIFAEDGLVKLCLSDREEGIVCFYSGETLEIACRGLEGQLQRGCAEWRYPFRS